MQHPAHSCVPAPASFAATKPEHQFTAVTSSLQPHTQPQLQDPLRFPVPLPSSLAPKPHPQLQLNFPQLPAPRVQKKVRRLPCFIVTCAISS